MQKGYVQKLGELFKRAREDAGLSKQQAADLAYIHVTSLVGYENGTNEPSVAKAVRLCKVYGIPVDSLDIS